MLAECATSPAPVYFFLFPKANIPIRDRKSVKCFPEKQAIQPGSNEQGASFRPPLLVTCSAFSVSTLTSTLTSSAYLVTTAFFTDRNPGVSRRMK